MTLVNDKLIFQFLDTIKDSELKRFIQPSVLETMSFIQLCYNHEYNEFLKSKELNCNGFFMFDDVTNVEFADYVHKRFNIEVKEVHYFEFVV